MKMLFFVELCFVFWFGLCFGLVCVLVWFVFWFGLCFGLCFFSFLYYTLTPRLEPMKKHRLDAAIHSLALLGNYSMLVGTENGLTLLHAVAGGEVDL
jgi:hypothetical protein